MSVANDPRIVEGVQGALLECPVWDAEARALWFVDIVAPALCRLDTTSGTLNKWMMPSDIGCFALRAKGGVILALRDGLYGFDPGSGQMHLIHKADYDPATTRFNDGRCDRQGRFWIGSMYEPRDKPLGALYRLDADLSLHKILDGVTVANGLAFTPDGTGFYWADSPARTVWRYDLDIKGLPQNKRVFYNFASGEGRPDGAAVDAQGNYWVAAVDGARLLAINPAGHVIHSIAMPVRWPTMPAFGGPDLKTIYVTSLRHGRSEEQLQEWPLSGCLFQMTAPNAGLPEARFAG